MTDKGQPVEVGILVYPGAQLAAVYGLTDLFAVAKRLATARGGGTGTALRVSHFAPDVSGGAPTCSFDTDPELDHRLVAKLLPPSLGAPPRPESANALAGWLRELHSGGTLLCSICAGAFVLGGTGLLAGRAATTHWSYAEAFASRFPEVRVDVDKLIIEDGDIITAGGLLAWTDLGLKLVDRLLGPTVMLQTARFLLVDPAGREQRFYSSFSPRLHHGDAAILKVQHWLQTQEDWRSTMPEMAARAGLTERTFMRRFRKATGLKPTEYCQRLRVGKAREMLEFTGRSVDEIAWSVGYGDTSSFRKVFYKVMGLSPGEYRRRFGVKAST
jgi:transcriptional regulator GlxA family with amidase domain